MTRSRERTTGDRVGSEMEFQHLISEAGEDHVTIVGRHDLDSSHPDVPAHLIEITNVDVDVRAGTDDERDRARRDVGSEHKAQALAVRQFLAD